MPALTSRPLRVFLCHSSGDKSVVRELYQKLSAEGWIDVWLDEEKLLPGQDWDYEIEKALDNSDVVIVTLSTGSVSKEGYVQRELRTVLDIALEKPEGIIFIVPLRLDECERPRKLRSIQGIDYFPPERRDWAYARLQRSLELRAKHLNLLTEEPKTAIPAAQLSPWLTRAEPTTKYVSVSPKPTSSVAPPSVATRINVTSKYMRMLVIFLLVLGVFGPWVRVQNGQISGDVLFDPSNPNNPFGGYWMAIVIVSLFLITILRLFSWRFSESKVIVRLERLIASIASLHGLFFGIIAFVESGSRWGYWSLVIGFCLAPINIFFELRPAMQKGQKYPWWAWGLMVPFIVVLFFVLILIILSQS